MDLIGSSIIGLVVGFQKEKIEGLIKEIDKENRITIFRNTEFTKGSVISIVKASNFFEHQEEMILMDGDVLYHYDKDIVVDYFQPHCIPTIPRIT